MPDSKIELTLDERLVRRLQAKAADEGRDLNAILTERLLTWLGPWGERTAKHTVTSGETLGLIAKRYYGDPRKFAVIAVFNNLVNPSLIHPGQVLEIPEAQAVTEPDQPVGTQPQQPLKPLPQGESPYIFGLHDRGGEGLMEQAGRKGWVLCTEELGANPNDWGSRSYRDLAERGYGVIVRLNYGYTPNGTLPHSDKYNDFAVRCGNFVEKSEGCHIWIIANEPNLAYERPGGPGNGEPITPDKYIAAFKACRREIKRRPGHAGDQVVTAAVGPWNVQTAYPTNPSGDWVIYFQDILKGLQGDLDGIAIHTYARDGDPAKITSEARMSPPFEQRRSMFRTYIDFMQAIPASLRHLPVYLTETDQNEAWLDTNNGWIQQAYAEINRWNSDPAHQKIRCMLLYRWEKADQWCISNKGQLLDDFRAALQHEYRWRS